MNKTVEPIRILLIEDDPGDVTIVREALAAALLSSDRPYRRAWPEHKVEEYIRGESGKHFDPKVLSASLDLLMRTPM